MNGPAGVFFFFFFFLGKVQLSICMHAGNVEMAHLTHRKEEVCRISPWLCVCVCVSVCVCMDLRTCKDMIHRKTAAGLRLVHFGLLVLNKYLW